MKKILCFIITISLVLTSASAAYAKPHNAGKQNKQQKTEEQQKTEKQKIKQQKEETERGIQSTYQQDTDQNNTNQGVNENKQSFKIDGSPVIKYGKYKLPIRPITQGMGAEVDFNSQTAILIVKKDNTTIVINFKEKTVTVNGVTDYNPIIFTAANEKKTVVLIQYIAEILGAGADVDDGEVIIVVPGLDLPTNVKITPIGTNTVADTLNSTTLYLYATANITAGQATGGRAELYVGNKLVTVDSEITATDTMVAFSTSDGTPTNAELKAIIPEGGVVSVKLYNSKNQSVTSAAANPTLKTDYMAPTITGAASAFYYVNSGVITIQVQGADAVNDIVDVTKIAITDTTLGRTYRLTMASNGVVSNTTTLTIHLCAADILGLSGFGNTTVFLTISAEPLLTDLAGNRSPGFTYALTVPVYLIR